MASTTALDQPTFLQQASIQIMAHLMASDNGSQKNLDTAANRAQAAAQALWNTLQGSNPQGGDTTDTGSTTVDDDT